ncbi:MAG: LytTR family transcriptional regulator, partial [Bacteroidetes bacterium]
RIPLRDILYFENVADYVRIKTNNGQHLIYSTLKSIDKKLPPELFVRVHRSYIVNLEKIVDIEENTLVIDRTVIPIGKAHRANLMSRLYTL